MILRFHYFAGKMDPKGKISLVTGGAAGIGLAIVKELLQQGVQVIIRARTPMPAFISYLSLDSMDMPSLVCDARGR